MRMFALIILFASVMTVSQAQACGDTCGWDGLYGTSGYSGYGWGSSMYDIGSFGGGYGGYDNWGGGCGSFSSSCGGSGSTITIDISIYTGGGSTSDVCGGYCSGGSHGGGYGGGYGSFMDPMSQYMNYPTSLYNINNPFGNYGGNNVSVNYPGINLPGVNYPSPFFNYNELAPFINYPYYRPPMTTPSMFPTFPQFPGMNPNIGYNPIYPQQPPYTLTPPPPSTQLPWGGCDNITVMCPTGPITRPPYTGPNPPVIPPVVNPPGNNPTTPGTPTYQTIPTDPIRYQVPRGAHR